MIRKISYTFIAKFTTEINEIAERDVVFIKPFGSRLFRVFSAPTYKLDEHGNAKMINHEELVQVLNTICTRYHKGIWYFRIPTEEVKREIAEIFIEMEQGHLFVEPDEVQLN
jgi:hypothetical protein